MAYDKKIVADSVVTRLIETQGIYQSMNRSFDGLVRPGASSVDVPKLAIPVVKTSGTALDGGDRSFAHAETTMMNIPLSAYAVPLAEELLAQFETNGTLIKAYMDSAALALQEAFDTLVITEAQTTTDKTSFADASMAWEDVCDVANRMDKNKVPRSQRVIVIDANIAPEFFAIDVVKDSLGYNQAFLQSGSLVSVMGMKFFISGLVPTVTISTAAKYNMVGIYGPGLAFILDRMGEVKEAWDTVNLQTVVDVVAHAGAKLFDAKFSVVKYKP